LFTASHSILARWRNHFSQLLNVHAVNDVRQTETHITKLLMLDPSAFKVEIAIEKLKRYKSPGIDQILAKAGVEQFALRSIYLLILFRIRRCCLRSEGVDHCTCL